MLKSGEPLNRDGLIPIDDESGHRGASELWRRHCQRAEFSRAAMLPVVHRLRATGLQIPMRFFRAEGDHSVGLGSPSRHMVHHQR